MTTVTVRFSPLPAHVRTARLVAAAVARRSGVEEGVLDEVRLAVGEACSRAVDLHQQHCPDEPVTVALTDGRTTFSVEVVDRAPDGQGSVLEALAEGAGSSPVEEGLPDHVGLAVITGLVDDVDVQRSAQGMALRMTWPLVGSAAPES